MATKTSNKYIQVDASYNTLPCSGLQPSETKLKWIIPLNATRTGSPLPTFRSKIDRGESATTSLTANRDVAFYKSGKVVAQITNNACPNKGMQGYSTFCGLSPTLPSFLAVPASRVSDARNTAAIGIRNRIQEETDRFSGLTFLGELRESIHMIRHPAQALREYTDNFLQSNLKKKRRMTKRKFGHALAGSWLEFAFGAAPLMNDITAIADASITRIDENRIIRVSYTGHSEGSVSNVQETGVGGISVIASYTVEQVQAAHVRYLVGLRRNTFAENSSLQNIVDLGGFRLDQVIPTAWELLPWSFFIDYFSNIGNVISSSLVSLRNVAWSQETVRTESSYHTHSGKFRISPGSGLIITEEKAPEYFARRSTVTRAAADIPFGSVRFELPGRSSQFLNLSALAALQFK